MQCSQRVSRMPNAERDKGDKDQVSCGGMAAGIFASCAAACAACHWLGS
jgi:hypothetical protein